MDMSQICQELANRGENFVLEDVKIPENLVAEISGLLTDLIEIDPHHTWISMVRSGRTEGTLETFMEPMCYNKSEETKHLFAVRLGQFYDLLEKMEIEGLL